MDFSGTIIMMTDEVNGAQIGDNTKNHIVVAQALVKATTIPNIHIMLLRHLMHLLQHLLRHLHPMQTPWKSFVEIGNFIRGIRQRWRNYGSVNRPSIKIC